MAGKISYYILFANYTHGLTLQELLRSNGLQARIAPTPRAIQGELSCGMSLLVEEEMIDRVRECIQANDAVYHAIVPVENAIQPNRNRFC